MQVRRHVKIGISELVNCWPRRLHAVTAWGSLLEVVDLILVHTISFYV